MSTSQEIREQLRARQRQTESAPAPSVDQMFPQSLPNNPSISESTVDVLSGPADPFSAPLDSEWLALNSAAAIFASPLPEFANRAAKKMKLSPSDTVCLRTFSELSSAEREIMLYGELLDLKAMARDLRKASSGQNWAASDDVTSAIARYCRTILLLGNLKYFTGNISTVITACMRKACIPNLPDPDDEVANTKFSHLITSALTYAKSNLKKTIKQSSTKNNKKSVSQIAEVLCSDKYVQAEPTKGLYMIIAMIRNELRKDKLSTKNFWDNVDRELDSLREGGQAEFLGLLDILLENDEKKFGRAAESGVTIGKMVDSSSPKWLQELNMAAPLVQRHQKRKKDSADIEDLEYTDEEGGES